MGNREPVSDSGAASARPIVDSDGDGHHELPKRNHVPFDIDGDKDYLRSIEQLLQRDGTEEVEFLASKSDRAAASGERMASDTPLETPERGTSEISRLRRELQKLIESPESEISRLNRE